MNALGRWIEANTNRRDFAKLIKMNVGSVDNMCSRYGVPEKHIEMVHGITKIPRSQLRGDVRKSNAQPKGLTFDGAYWVDGVV